MTACEDPLDLEGESEISRSFSHAVHLCVSFTGFLALLRVRSALTLHKHKKGIFDVFALIKYLFALAVM